MKALPEIIKKMEDIGSKMAEWGIKVDVLTQLDAFPMSVSVTDRHGNFEAVNKAFCKMTGYEEEEIIGKPFLIIFPKEQQEYYRTLYQKLQEGSFSYSGEHPVLNKKGERKKVVSCISIFPLKSQKKRITLSLEINSELEEKGQELDTLTDLNAFINRINKETKQSFDRLASQEVASSIFRHDLKKHIQNIVSLCRMLGDEGLPEKERKNITKMIVESGESAMEEMENSRRIELMESGRYKLDVKEFDLMVLLEKIHKKLEVYFNSKNLKLLIQSDNPKHFQKSKEPYHINADQFFIEMMLTNLLQNAAEASPENETILVDITTATLLTEISIHNWGTVPNDVKKHFFEKYITKGKSQGTGLGTYVCKMIAEAHEGMINMESTAEKGTYVVVALPLNQQSKPRLKGAA